MATRDWLDMSHGSTSANDGDALTFVFDGVKQLGEVPRGIGSTNFCHQIRLSDISCRRSDVTGTKHWRQVAEIGCELSDRINA
jgi:hypothetical protein